MAATAVPLALALSLSFAAPEAGVVDCQLEVCGCVPAVVEGGDVAAVASGCASALEDGESGSDGLRRPQAAFDLPPTGPSIGVRAGVRRVLLVGAPVVARDPRLLLLHDHRPENNARSSPCQDIVEYGHRCCCILPGHVPVHEWRSHIRTGDGTTIGTVARPVI